MGGEIVMEGHGDIVVHAVIVDVEDTAVAIVAFEAYGHYVSTWDV